MIISFNTAMALETESLSLDQELISPGVCAVLSDERKGIYFVAEIEGKIAGQMMITFEWSDWRNGTIWWIQSVYVPTGFRRQGVFKSLYQYVREEARKADVVALRLYVERDNKAAQKTYESLGMHLSHYLLMEEALPRCG
jgi:ribosomal protein S18 acetylase RimI-like enzyme